MTESVVKGRRAAWRIKLEPRLEEPAGWFPAAVSMGAIVVALILGGVIIAFVGGNPLLSYAHIARASFGGVGVLSDTIVKATPIILAALACSIAFRMKLWNIGAEGQFIMGAFGASAIVLRLFCPLKLALRLSGDGAGRYGGGRGLGIYPGYLKAKFNVNEIISTLMMNYIAIAWITFGSSP